MHLCGIEVYILNNKSIKKILLTAKFWTDLVYRIIYRKHYTIYFYGFSTYIFCDTLHCIFCRTSPFMFHGRKKVWHVWNDTRVRKLWQFSIWHLHIHFRHFWNYVCYLKLPIKLHMLVHKTARDCFIFLHWTDIFNTFRITSSLLFKVSNCMLLITHLRPTSEPVS